MLQNCLHQEIALLVHLHCLNKILAKIYCKKKTDSWFEETDAGLLDNTQELSENWHYIISLNGRGIIACKVDEARKEGRKGAGFVLANWATFHEKRREDVSKAVSCPLVPIPK